MSVAVDIPIVEQIAEVLYARLQLTTSNYYADNPVVEVVRPTRHGVWTPKHQQIILTQDAAIRERTLDYPGNPPALCWVTRFNIRCHVMPSETETDPYDRELNYLLAGVHKSVTDATNWETFDGLSVHAEWSDQERVVHDGGVSGINQPIDITYRVSELSDYVLRL